MGNLTESRIMRHTTNAVTLLTLVGSISLSLLLASCGDRQASHDSRRMAVLVPLEVIELQEPEPLVVALPQWLARSTSGGYLVSDGLMGRVLEFDSGGSFVRAAGRKGRGPGEFEVLYTTIDADSVLYAVDLSLRRILSLPKGSSTWRERPSTSLPFVVSGMALDSGGGLWISGVGAPGNAALVRWRPGSDSVSVVRRLPTAIQEHPNLMTLAGTPPALSGDSLLLGFGALDWLFIMDKADGRIRDSLVIPRRARRGAPSASLVIAGRRLLNAASTLSWVGVISKGRAVALHRDFTATRTTRAAKYYLTVFGRLTNPSCVDVVIPTDSTSVPPALLSADTLFLLEQPLDSIQGARLVVKSYLIDPAGQCLAAD